ncbi:TIGR01777 family protein [Epidermidibacterium keratini]|uniref:TIGR01777 family protein n=1 Tax=Epidermidibacterium keratini TaxID=1891644 RepID=A0A7L4YPY4_9ACTN|nr:TIGR01777 family oxidoreductase [Epidermidibacterium keratini]QHC00617.1 TIGR01777 family protein [Epidermidibacterium keratini]
MARYTHRTVLPYDRQTVFDWHERPGALVRLTPPGLAKVESEPSDGVRNGSRATVKALAPMTMGAAGLRMVAEHVGYNPPDAFEDVQAKGPLQSWHHRRRFLEIDEGTAIEEQIDFQAPGPRVARAVPEAVIKRGIRRGFDYRERQLLDDLRFHAEHQGRRLRIVVAGSTGLVGTQLVALLGGGGHEVVRLVRSDPGPGEIGWDVKAGQIDVAGIRAADVVIHLGGTPIAGRFTDKHKRDVLDSRVDSTLLLARTLADLASDGKKRTFICASAVGYYGADRGDEILTEDSAPGSDFLAEVCQKWEAACEPARQAGVRVVNVRTGIVQSGGGGQLALQQPLFELGLGGRLGDGQQWMPWITVDDLAGLYAHIALTDGLSGPVNASAPEPVRNADYTRALAGVLRRPALLPVPSFGPKLLLGDEGAREFALAGQRISAQRALDWGYRFRHEDLRAGLSHVLAL